MNEPELSPKAAQLLKSKKPVSMSIIKTVVDALMDQILDTEAALNARIDVLEEKALSYEGVHEKGRTYAPNTLVTAKGGLWVAKALTNAVPGTSDDWKLTHKTVTARGTR